jgi:hypothetical protein
VAVFPDRIVLKNSTDSQAAIEAAIGSGGTDQITQGEVVVGLEANAATFYTIDGSGNVVTIGSAAGQILNLGDLLDVDLTTPATDGQVIAYNSTSGNWEPVDQSGGLANIVEDLTPQLGGDLDVNGYYIVSASGGDVVVAPNTTGDFVVRGNSTDGSITLNCTANTHGVTIQSPPHADAATYTLILPSSAGTVGQVLTSQGGAQLTWEDAGGGVTSINDLADVDTSTTPPTTDQALIWNGTTWVPGDVATGGGGSGAGVYLTETQLASGGTADFTGLGYSGILQKVTSDLAAWIVLYSSAAERTADAGRAYNTDPTPGSGVLFEAYVTAGGTVVATPGTTYMNNDVTLTEAVYAAVRDQAGVAVNASVTFSAYGLAAITSVVGGTFGSG